MSVPDSVSQTSKLLFEGSWNGTSKEFEGLRNFEIFRFFIQGMSTPVLCCGHVNSTSLRGYCAYTTDYPETHVYTIYFSKDRDWLNLETCYDATVSGGNVVKQNPTITAIYGVK